MGKHILPKGFTANGIHCGVKKKRKDLSVFYSKKICKVEAMFTKNLVKAAPVKLAEKQLSANGYAHAVVVNSGNANCMTGKRGLNDAMKMAKCAEKILNVPKNTVLVSSTGIIGQFMKMRPILKGIPEVIKGLSKNGLLDATDGIMTTDQFRKISTRIFDVAGKKVTMTGIAKGAGMINPNMATMLCYIFTDANISKKAMKKALADTVDVTFNAITVDGDMSTNDTVMLLANGEAKNKCVEEGTGQYKDFEKNLKAIAKDLAVLIVKDGEGATKFIEVKVSGALKENDAKKISKAVASSLLVKCAVLGGDPNWGRIASSAGSSGAEFDPDKMEILLDGVTFFEDGKAVFSGDRKAVPVFKRKEVKIGIKLHQGKHEAVSYSCDISKKYIAFNSYYTT